MISKDIIKKRFALIYTLQKKNNAKVECYQVVQAILYRLKTGCQWQELPMKQFFTKKYNLMED